MCYDKSELCVHNINIVITSIINTIDMDNVITFKKRRFFMLTSHALNSKYELKMTTFKISKFGEGVGETISQSDPMTKTRTWC